MSNSVTNWVKTQRVGNPAGKAVLLALADHANEEGKTWVGHETIAMETEYSERTVWEWINRLERAGFIKRKRRHDKKGHRKTDMITIRLPAGDASRDDGLPAAHAEPTRSSPQSLPVGAAEEPSIEPSKEPSPLPPSRGRSENGHKIKIHRRDFGFGLWEDHYRSAGREDVVREAHEKGFFLERTKCPPAIAEPTRNTG